MNITKFSAPITNTTEGELSSPGEVIKLIKSTKYKNEIIKLRNLKTKEEKRKFKAQKLDYVTWGGYFQKREDKALETYSQLMVIDIDNIEMAVDGLKEKMIADRFTFICFVSPSGQGLKIIFKLNSKNAKMHLNFFWSIEKYFKTKYGIDIDKSGKDLSRACFLSYDPEIFVNWDCITWDEFLEKEKAAPEIEKKLQPCGEYIEIKGLTELKKLKVSDKIKTLIIEHLDSTLANEYEKDRSRIDEAITESLIRAGYDDTTIFDIFFNEKFKCSAKVKDKGYKTGQKYIAHNIKTAREHINDSWDSLGAVEKINEIRHKKKLNQAEKIELMRKIIITDLKHYGVFVFDKRLRISYYFNKEKKELEDFSDERRVKGFLCYKYRLLTLEINNIVTGLARMIEEEGIKCEISKFVKFDDNTVFLSTFDGQYFEITEDNYDQKTIGLDKILFKPNIDFQKVVPEFSGQEVRYFDGGFGYKKFTESLLYKYVFGKINFKEDAILSKEERIVILLVWFYQMFFRTVAPTRPIILMFGDKGSGKSFFGRTIGRILFSSEFNVLPLPKDVENFRVVANSEMFFVLDNVDRFHGWVQDELAVISTGGISKSRELYTSRGISSMRPDCFMVVTSRNPSTLRRDDLAERTIKIEVKELERHVSEWNFYQELAGARGEIWGEIIVNIQDILKLHKDNDVDKYYNFRLAEFAKFTDILLNNEKTTNDLLRKLKGSSEEFSIVGTVYFDSLMGYLRDEGEIIDKATAGEIIDKVFDEGYLRKYGRRSTQTKFGIWLNKNIKPLKQFFDIDISESSRKQIYSIKSIDVGITSDENDPF